MWDVSNSQLVEPSRACDGMIVGVDASRNRSGGAVAHIRGLLSGDDPQNHGIARVHLWAHDALLDVISEKPWLTKHRVAATNGSIPRQMVWQRFSLPRLARDLGVSVMFNTDAGSVCSFLPCATLSQDMLSFEPGEMQRYPWPERARFRLELLRFVQLYRLRRSTKALFLSKHAQQVIGGFVSLRESAVIPHGIDRRFFEAGGSRRIWPTEGPVRCLYVSNVAPYKHQWHVVAAFSELRARTGRDLRLRLVGGGGGVALSRLQCAVAECDPHGQFVEMEDFIPNEAIANELAVADLFVYASSCENLPITLLEAMASGVPIASSNRGPMPEVLGNSAALFDPEDPQSIANAVEELLRDDTLRNRSASEARRRAEGYTWKLCAGQTWRELASIARENHL